MKRNNNAQPKNASKANVNATTPRNDFRPAFKKSCTTMDFSNQALNNKKEMAENVQKQPNLHFSIKVEPKDNVPPKDLENKEIISPTPSETETLIKKNESVEIPHSPPKLKPKAAAAPMPSPYVLRQLKLHAKPVEKAIIEQKDLQLKNVSCKPAIPVPDVRNKCVGNNKDNVVAFGCRAALLRCQPINNKEVTPRAEKIANNINKNKPLVLKPFVPKPFVPKPHNFDKAPKCKNVAVDDKKIHKDIKTIVNNVLPCETKQEHKEQLPETAAISQAPSFAGDQSSVSKILAIGGGSQKILDDAWKRMEEEQTKFLNLYKSCSADHNKEFKLLAVKKNDIGELIVKKEELKFFKDLPLAAVPDLKTKLELAMQSIMTTASKKMEGTTVLLKTKRELKMAISEEKNKQLKCLDEYLNSMCNENSVAKSETKLDEKHKISADEAKEKYEEEIREAEENYKIKVEELTKQLKSISDEKLNSEKQLLEAVKSAKAEGVERQKELDKYIKKLQEELKLSKKEAEVQKTEKEQLLAQNKEDVKVIKKMEKNNAQLEQQVTALELHDKQVNTLIDQMKEQKDNYKRELKEQQQKCKELELKMAKIQKETLSKDEVHELKKKLKAVEAEKDELKKQINDMENEKVPKAKYESLERKLKAVKSEYTMKQADMADYVSFEKDLKMSIYERDHKISALQKKLEQRDAELKELKEQMAKMEQLPQPQDEANKKVIEDLRYELEATRNDLKRAHLEVFHCEEIIAHEKSLVDFMQTRIEEYSHENLVAKAQLASLTATVKEMNAREEAKSEEFQNLFETLSEKQLTLARQENDNKMLLESNERGLAQRTTLEQENSRLRHELATIKAQLFREYYKKDDGDHK